MAGRLQVVNVETGEIVTEDYSLRHRNQETGYQKRKSRGSNFTFASMNDLHEVYTVLTTAQCGYLLLLQCHVDYMGGTLLNSDKTPMTKADMMAVLQLDKKRSVFYNFFHAATSNGILIANEDGTFAVNQRYHFRGATDNPYVVKSYSAKVKRVYREVRAADLGLIYRMLPLVHYETNGLCSNPHEQAPERINFLDRDELAEATGVSPGEISRRLPKMTFDGEYVIARVKVGGHVKYMFNPWVFYRKASTPDNTLRSMFNVKPARKGGNKAGSVELN